MGTVTLTPPNAILFLFDRSNKVVTVPEYVEGQLVASTDSCISIGTRAAVDGDVSISVGPVAPSPVTGVLMKLFSGVLHAPSRRLAVVTADARPVLECAVSGDKAVLEVWADDPRNPAQIAVVVR